MGLVPLPSLFILLHLHVAPPQPIIAFICPYTCPFITSFKWCWIEGVCLLALFQDTLAKKAFLSGLRSGVILFRCSTFRFDCYVKYIKKYYKVIFIIARSRLKVIFIIFNFVCSKKYYWMSPTFHVLPYAKTYSMKLQIPIQEKWVFFFFFCGTKLSNENFGVALYSG